ncbi:hypothetical protein HanXRQr2_Chr16g0763631 [Helianthus annuus]|uniref:Uncharacterized protein n=1 Tax=Helianthus annuus TaxID=4232 RepID=A0A9K3DUP3_HELAN|nr:hypothetical protein HanXRQr2_Chr16g0763631 [Helianthus annuus]KAJ0439201.1 hypothetical protein HanHA300_Chr16g0622611 [Helianthus annuus]KAJ0444223.1 hypothetical protein HanIR_Chr16g0829421 [Helianthus annuus]KAJ0461546.1 hypothetical protein HanHA89_Chr16g0673451 [Helianthus annuus]KAJ0641974.1 hypothetical protein HanLR1_Chr16g0633121 [Helianthus annuus]
MRVGFRSRYLKRDMRKTLRLLLRKQFRKPPVTDQTLFSAGRTQDNEPLMRALSKLIYVNSPDLVLFVGEALVRQQYLLFWLYKILWDMCIVLTVDVVVIPNKGGVAIY